MEKLKNESEHEFSPGSLSFGTDTAYTLLDSTITTGEITKDHSVLWERNVIFEDTPFYFIANSSKYFEDNITLT